MNKHPNNLFHELYTLFDKSPSKMIKAYNAGLKAYNAESGPNYQANIVHMWDNGTANFPEKAKEWARSLVIPHISKELMLDEQIIHSLIKRLT